MSTHTFPKIDDLVTHLRDDLKENPNAKDYKYILLFAYNGVGKTRLSAAFKDFGKSSGTPDTLYFNAFTEDLFHWDNDLEGDSERVLKLNENSKFFPDLESLEIEDKIRQFLHRYVDFNFSITTQNGINIHTEEEIKYRTVNFNREVLIDGTMTTIDSIKISRGEESIFIWCFFLAIAQLAIDEHEEYKWVKYLYIDDPISSLDDNNTIYVASHLAQLLKDNNKLKVIISSHHSLFYNVMWNELNETKKLKPYFLNNIKETNEYTLQYTKETPFFHHVAIIKELHDAVTTGKLYAYHFNILRNIMEKTSTFLGLKKFSDCIQLTSDEEEKIYSRMVNILSHGNYSLFEPKEMVDENKEHFRKIFKSFVNKYNFNPELFSEPTVEEVS
jgi:wobble nucleotide-excising tRNase